MTPKETLREELQEGASVPLVSFCFIFLFPCVQLCLEWVEAQHYLATECLVRVRLKIILKMYLVVQTILREAALTSGD